MSESEKTLAKALSASLRWPYSREIRLHAETGVMVSPGRWSEAYIRDVRLMHEGVKAALAIGEWKP